MFRLCLICSLLLGATEVFASEGSAGGTYSATRSVTRTRPALFARRTEGSSGGTATSEGSAGGTFSVVRERRQLFGRRHENHESNGSAGGVGGYGSAGGTALRSSCACGNPNCTGKRGCQCGDPKCTCNDQPTTTAPAETPPTAVPPTSSGSNLNSTESEMVAAVNAYRAARNLPPLVVDTTLMTMARSRVGVFNHNHPRFGWCHDQARRYGYVATDNLAQGYSDGAEAVHGWATSDGHAKQMQGKISMNGKWIDEHFDSLGVARQGANWIAVFGKRG